MAGILDSKTRIFDTIITQEGRRQIARGKLKAEYYSFTDGHAIYNNDTIISGSSVDETYRACFEATPMPYDQITFEADDSGKLMQFRGLNDISIQAGQIYSGSSNELLTDNAFASTATEILTSASIDSFKQLRILGSPEFFRRDNNDFLIGNDKYKFTITDALPISSSAGQEGYIDQMESLFMDKRLSHIPNFQYLPPVNKARAGSTTTPLGVFPSLGQAPIQTIEDLEQELEFSRSKGFEQISTFYETSTQNNLVCQMFEVSGNSIVKLDIIDFGLFSTPTNAESPTKHVFFVGKVFTDTTGAATFVCLWTVIFE